MFVYPPGMYIYLTNKANYQPTGFYYFYLHFLALCSVSCIEDTDKALSFIHAHRTQQNLRWSLLLAWSVQRFFIDDLQSESDLLGYPAIVKIEKIIEVYTEKRYKILFLLAIVWVCVIIHVINFGCQPALLLAVTCICIQKVQFMTVFRFGNR